jgi:hypothetical protein
MFSPSARTSWHSLVGAALLSMTVSACAGDITGNVEPAAAVSGYAAASDYEIKLAEYRRLHGAYERKAEAYWDAVADKRRARNAKRRDHQRIVLTDYVLTQPPVYKGPPYPVDPNAPPPAPSQRHEIPVVADFLEAAAEQWNFVPDRPRSEAEFKRAYAQAALEAGLDRQQVVGIYAFETGGHGSYDTQAGLLFDRPGARAISPALGYNQLLSTLTIALLAEHGDHVLAVLKRKAAGAHGEARRRMAHKIAVVRRMIAFSRSVPHRWSEYQRLAKNTRKGLGLHAVLLDVDIGPLLQVQNLANSVRFAHARGYEGRLSAAELELMNLTGTGNGIDMVMMPPSMRDRVPTSNFFVRAGYRRNPIAYRTKVVSNLIAEIQNHIDRSRDNPGARELAAAF